MQRKFAGKLKECFINTEILSWNVPQIFYVLLYVALCNLSNTDDI